MTDGSALRQSTKLQLEQKLARVQQSVEQVEAAWKKADAQCAQLKQDNTGLKVEIQKLEGQLDVHNRRQGLLDRGAKTWANTLVDLRRQVDDLTNRLGDMPSTLAA